MSGESLAAIPSHGLGDSRCRQRSWALDVHDLRRRITGESALALNPRSTLSTDHGADQLMDLKQAHHPQKVDSDMIAGGMMND